MKLVAILTMTLLVSGCVLPDRYVQWEAETPRVFPILTAIGYAPLESQQAESKSQKVLMAMRASKLDAYRELTEQIYGVKLSGNSQVADNTLQSNNLEAAVSGVIRGAKVVKSYPTGEHYVTELQLDYAQVWDLFQQHNRPQKVKSVTYF